MAEIEALLLTGGASKRMGRDKASIPVDGVPMAQLIAGRVLDAGYPVTVCGSSSLPGCDFLEDDGEHRGPLAAVRRFAPRAETVFIAACDMPLFDAAIIPALYGLLAEHDAAVPVLEAKLQPLAALYTADAVKRANATYEAGKRSMMAWLDSLNVRVVEAQDVPGLSLMRLAGADTPMRLQHILEFSGDLV